MASEKILVVEDEVIVSENIKNILTRLHYSVCGIAGTGEEALEKTAELKPNLVLMDIKLKGELDGIETAEKIRSQFNIPVIYLTAFVDDNILKRAKITEPFGYILKPFEIRDLHTSIEIALHKHRIENRIHFSNRLLQIANQSNTISLMLRQFLIEIKQFTKYSAAGVRLLNEKGCFPFIESYGFPKPFLDNESKHSLKTNQQIYTKVIRGKTDSRLSHFTARGSFYTNDVKQFMKSLRKNEYDVYAVLNDYTCQSLSLIPISVKTEILGFLHIVDRKKDQMPPEILTVLEEAALQLGVALKRMQVEQTLKKHHGRLEELVEERTSELTKTNRKLQKEILEHKKTTEELHESKSSFHNIVTKSGEGIVVVDHENRVQFLNPIAREYLGPISKHLIGNLFPYTPINGQSEEIIINLPEKTTGTGEIRSVHTKWEGKEAHLVTILDITERKKIEQMKSDFVSLVSHQLKTPVAEIKEFTDIMLRGMTGEFSDKQKQYLREMYHISARNYRLISTLLDVSRIERKAISVTKSSFEIREIIDMVMKINEDSAKEKGLTLQCHIADTNLSILADRDKLLEALTNILDNAVKFTDKGSITIQATSKDDFCYIRVTDTGIGIDRDIRNKLFQRDQILHGGPSTKSGCGLGLYITREFLKLQNGDIYLDSTGKRGSCFVIKIPLSK